MFSKVKISRKVAWVVCMAIGMSFVLAAGCGDRRSHCRDVRRHSEKSYYPPPRRARYSEHRVRHERHSDKHDRDHSRSGHGRHQF